MTDKQTEFRRSIETAINYHSMENGSDTPDWVLAEYLTDCLAAYDKTVAAREKWYGRACGGGATANAPVGPSDPVSV